MNTMDSNAHSTACKDRSELMNNTLGAKFLCFLTGMSIGAVVGMLYAPNSGRRTRELIADQAGEGRDYLMRKGREICGQAANSVERGKEVLTDQRDHLVAAVERGKEVLADQRDHLVAAVAAGKQAYRAEAQSKSTP